MESSPPPVGSPGHSRGLRHGLILAGVVVVAMVVLVAAAVLVIDRVLDGVDTTVAGTGPNAGEPDRISVIAGQPFDFHGQEFAPGWFLSRSGGTLRPRNLVFTSTGDAGREAEGRLKLRVYRRGVLLGTSECRSEASLEPGPPNEMLCAAIDGVDTDYDRLEVGDFRLRASPSS